MLRLGDGLDLSQVGRATSAAGADPGRRPERIVYAIRRAWPDDVEIIADLLPCNAGDLSSASFGGSVGWYQRDFTIPPGAFPSYVPKSAQRWVIQFESVNYSATVWLNGHKLGTHAGAYLPFEFTMKYLQAGVNQLVVRVDDRLSGATSPHSTLGWWNYGGILDAVYMRPVSGVEIDDIRIRTIDDTGNELSTPQVFAGAGASQALKSAAVPTPVQPGSQQLSVSVNVQFEIAN